MTPWPSDWQRRGETQRDKKKENECSTQSTYVTIDHELQCNLWFVIDMYIKWRINDTTMIALMTNLSYFVKYWCLRTCVAVKPKITSHVDCVDVSCCRNSIRSTFDSRSCSTFNVQSNRVIYIQFTFELTPHQSSTASSSSSSTNDDSSSNRSFVTFHAHMLKSNLSNHPVRNCVGKTKTNINYYYFFF